LASGEQDFTKRVKSKTDHWWIKGVELVDPEITAAIPISVENPAIAYEVATDRFKVKIESASGVTFDADISDDWARQLGLIDLSRVLGAALAHSNPVIARLTDGSAFIDPRDMIDRAARLVGIIYGSQSQQLLQRATTYDLLVQLRHNGAEINPQTIRALTSTDIITAYGSLDALQQRATTKELIVQISHQGVEKDPTQIRALTSSDIITAYGSQTQAILQRATTYDSLVQLRHSGAEIDPRNIRALTNSDVVTVEQATAANLKATVTQDAKDRTISDITKTATRKQFTDTWAAAGNKTAWDPAANKKVRLKLICLELSADVDLGYRWGAAGIIYYLRTTAGPIVINLVGCNDEGATDEILYLYASGACTVKGHFAGEEI